MAVDSVRREAVAILLRFEKSGKTRLKADALIQDALGRHPDFTESDRGFLQALVMGTLRAWGRLEVWIGDLTGRERGRIDPIVRTLLRLGLFQLSALDHVPAYAAINTTVELARLRKLSPKTLKFVNAVLREGQRRLEAGKLVASTALVLPDDPAALKDPVTILRQEAGWPTAWSERLLAQYPAKAVLAMARAMQQPPELTIRVNTLKTSREQYQALLAEHQSSLTSDTKPDWQIETVPELPEALQLTGFSGSPRQLPGYAEGLFYVQDLSSMWVGHLMQPQSGDRVLDLCAAPGSKTTHIAALMDNSGSVTAVDPKEDRLRLLRDNVARLGVLNTTPILADGLAFHATAQSAESAAPEGYDRVLVDAPCSGTGTLRRHPEILLQLNTLDLPYYQREQAALLTQGFVCLKPGGILVYSTCSILREENHQVVAEFLAAHPQARLALEEQRLITDNADGFYAARIIKEL